MDDETAVAVTTATANVLPVIEGKVVLAQPTAVTVPNAEQVNNDFTFARTTLIDLLTKGSAALEQLAEIAEQSQHPRSYEVLATLIKHLGDTNDKLLALHRDHNELVEVPKPSAPAVGNAIFVGTTADLLKMVKEHK